MIDTSLLQINLSAVARNMQVLRSMVGPECEICPIVKADAYGFGATAITPTLRGAGADMLAVYTPEQAAELSEAALGVPILVLMPVREIGRVDELYRGLICGKLHLTVHDQSHLDDVLYLAERFGAVLPVHLEVDTGMSRGGCSAADAPAIINRITTTRRAYLAGLFTHFARADNDPAFTDIQLERFQQVLDAAEADIPPECILHAANSAATFRHERFHKAMVRIGFAWAGYGTEWLPDDQRQAMTHATDALEPALRWTSHIVHIKTIQAGDTVGYGSRWTAGRTTRIGLVPVGYADGYPYGVGQTDTSTDVARVGVLPDDPDAGAFGYAPIIGAVNMDQIVIDLTDLPDGGASVAVGTAVELIGPDPAAPNHLPTLATLAGTIPHELTCRLNPRIRRTYYRDAPIVETMPTTAALVG